MSGMLHHIVQLSKVRLGSKKNKNPSNLPLFPPTQTSNYFTAFHKWPSSHTPISKNMRHLQMLFGSFMPTKQLATIFFTFEKQKLKAVSISKTFFQQMDPEATSIPINYAQWSPTGLAHIYINKILPKTRDWHTKCVWEWSMGCPHS